MVQIQTDTLPTNIEPTSGESVPFDPKGVAVRKADGPDAVDPTAVNKTNNRSDQEIARDKAIKDVNETMLAISAVSGGSADGLAPELDFLARLSKDDLASLAQHTEAVSSALEGANNTASINTALTKFAELQDTLVEAQGAVEYGQMLNTSAILNGGSTEILIIPEETESGEFKDVYYVAEYEMKMVAGVAEDENNEGMPRPAEMQRVDRNGDGLIDVNDAISARKLDSSEVAAIKGQDMLSEGQNFLANLIGFGTTAAFVEGATASQSNADILEHSFFDGGPSGEGKEVEDKLRFLFFANGVATGAHANPAGNPFRNYKEDTRTYESSVNTQEVNSKIADLLDTPEGEAWIARNSASILHFGSLEPGAASKAKTPQEFVDLLKGEEGTEATINLFEGLVAEFESLAAGENSIPDDIRQAMIAEYTQPIAMLYDALSHPDATPSHYVKVDSVDVTIRGQPDSEDLARLYERGEQDGYRVRIVNYTGDVAHSNGGVVRSFVLERSETDIDRANLAWNDFVTGLGNAAISSNGGINISETIALSNADEGLVALLDQAESEDGLGLELGLTDEFLDTSSLIGDILETGSLEGLTEDQRNAVVGYLGESLESFGESALFFRLLGDSVTGTFMDVNGVRQGAFAAYGFTPAQQSAFSTGVARNFVDNLNRWNLDLPPANGTQRFGDIMDRAINDQVEKTLREGNLPKSTDVRGLGRSMRAAIKQTGSVASTGRPGRRPVDGAAAIFSVALYAGITGKGLLTGFGDVDVGSAIITNGWAILAVEALVNDGIAKYRLHFPTTKVMEEVLEPIKTLADSARPDQSGTMRAAYGVYRDTATSAVTSRSSTAGRFVRMKQYAQKIGKAFVESPLLNGAMKFAKPFGIASLMTGLGIKAHGTENDTATKVTLGGFAATWGLAQLGILINMAGLNNLTNNAVEGGTAISRAGTRAANAGKGALRFTGKYAGRFAQLTSVFYGILDGIAGTRQAQSYESVASTLSGDNPYNQDFTRPGSLHDFEGGSAHLWGYVNFIASYFGISRAHIVPRNDPRNDWFFDGSSSVNIGDAYTQIGDEWVSTSPAADLGVHDASEEYIRRMAGSAD